MKQYRWILTVAVIMLLAIMSYYVVFNDSEKMVETAQLKDVSSFVLYESVKDSAGKSGSSYVNSIVQVSGKISKISDNTLVLDSLIQVDLQESVPVISNQQITIKGRCLGYDDLLELVKIDGAVIIKNNK